MNRKIINFVALCGLLVAVLFCGAVWAETKESELWSGEKSLGNWSEWIKINAADVSLVKAGDRVEVTVKSVDGEASAWPQVQLQTSGWEAFPDCPSKIISEPGVAVFEITSAMASDIRANGFIVKGNLLTVSAVKLVSTETSGGETIDKGPAVTAVWTGNLPISWNDPKSWGTFAASKFENAASGNILRFNITGRRPDAQAKLNTSTWGNFPGAVNSVQLTADNLDFDLTDDMVAELKSNGLIVSGIGFNLVSIEIIDKDKLPAVAATVNKEDIREWKSGESPMVRVSLTNSGQKAASVPVIVSLTKDDGTPMGSFGVSADTDAGTTTTVPVSIPLEEPGVYHICVYANNLLVESKNIASRLDEIVSSPDPQPDFQSFWNEAKEELNAVEPDYTLTEIPEKSTAARKVYLVQMKSVADEKDGEPVTIRGYYAEPAGEGEYPAIITYQGYDSDATATPYCPGGDENPGFAEFVLSTRGQSVNNRAPFENAYGDWFAYNFGNKDCYYYRGAYMDAVRAIDFMASRSKVNPGRIFAQGQSQGGALTIAAAALDDRLRAIAPAIPFMGDFPDYFQVGSWPANVAEKVRGDMTDEEMYAFLSYFDTKNLATAVKCPVLFTLGLQDNVCPPHTNIAAYNNLASVEKTYSVNSFLGHTVPSDWSERYIAFFNEKIAEGDVVYKNVDFTIWNMPCPINWSAVTLNAPVFKDVEAGDRLDFELSDIAGDRNSWPQFRILDKSSAPLYPAPDGTASFPLYDSQSGFSSPYTMTFTVTEEVLAKLREGGCRINGTGFTLASVSLHKTAKISNALKSPEPLTVWEGNEAISWSGDNKNSVLIDKAKFAETAAGAVLRVTMSGVANNAQLRLQANYTQFDPVCNVQLKGATVNETVLTKEMLDLIKEKGLRVTGCYYTLVKAEVVNPGQNIRYLSTVDYSGIRAYEKEETPSITVNLQSLEGRDYEVDMKVSVARDTEPGVAYREHVKTVALKAGEQTSATQELSLEPGFYNLTVSVGSSPVCSYVIGYDPTGVVSEYDGKADFSEFWEEALAELAMVEGRFEIEKEITDKSTSNRKVYQVKMYSVADAEGGEPVVIRGYYAEPVADGKYPVLIHYQGTDGGSSTPWCPGGDDNPDWCEFVLSVRGQMINNREPYLDCNIYQNEQYGIKSEYYTYGFPSLREHYYRNAYLDCVRAIDFVAQCPKADTDNIFAAGGSQGGAFTYAAAGLDHRLKAIAPSITGHSDFADDFKIVSWPRNKFEACIEAWNNTSGISALTRDAAGELSMDHVLDFLTYFDVKNFGPSVTCPVITNFSLQDTTDPPHVNVAPFNLLEKVDDKDKEYYVNPFLGHATAADWNKRYMEFFNRYRTGTTQINEIQTGSSDNIGIAVNDLNITVTGTEDGERINVYNLQGALVVSTVEKSFNLPSRGFYILSAGKGQTRKISL